MREKLLKAERVQKFREGSLHFFIDKFQQVIMIPYADCGSENDPDIESTRYTFFAAKVAAAVSRGEARCGILICGTGIGISMMAL